LKKLPHFFQGLFICAGLQFCCTVQQARTLGGSAAYNFMQLPDTPKLSALGGFYECHCAMHAVITKTKPATTRSDCTFYLAGKQPAYG
jgi:hypothetical protein